MTRGTRIRGAAVVALLGASVAAPTALAAGDGNGGIELRRDGSKAVRVVTVPEPAPADGFDWGDTALGAAGGMAALLLGAGAGHILRGRKASRQSAVVAEGAP